MRPGAHLEFLLRNTILKLPDWNHTIVCGNLNYAMMKAICDEICKDTKSKINTVK